jgi:DNA-directed RNA polymerase specialized sigma24 family protein
VTETATRESRDLNNPESAFTRFVDTTRPDLLRGLLGVLSREDAEDAVAEAFTYAWQEWDRVATMDNPGGYLFRVAQSRSRRRKVGHLPAAAEVGLPEIDPRLIPSLQNLPLTQRTAVWLIHGCGWSYIEVAEALDASVTAVGTHLERGMARLRSKLVE